MNHPIHIAQLNAASAGAWDAYVENHAQASVYHRAIWRDVIGSVFGHASIYLYARGVDAILGVLPLVRLKSYLFGDYLVSMPYFNYGGAISDSPAVAQRLMDAAAERASELGCSHVEFRDVEPRPSWDCRTDKVAMELALPTDPAALWSGFDSKLRAQVRKPQKEGAQFVYGGIELLADFYRVFARNMRDLGTPVYPKSFFQAILQAFPRQAAIALVRYRGRAVAAGFLLGHRDRLEIPWASSLREFNRVGVNMMLYAETLRTAIERGYRVFDFGRSTIDSGTYRFKKQWGCAPRPLYWHYWLAAGKELPRLNPDNPTYQWAIALWRRMPMFLANGLGPQIVKNLP